MDRRNLEFLSEEPEANWREFVKTLHFCEFIIISSFSSLCGHSHSTSSSNQLNIESVDVRRVDRVCGSLNVNFFPFRHTRNNEESSSRNHTMSFQEIMIKYSLIYNGTQVLSVSSCGEYGIRIRNGDASKWSCCSSKRKWNRADAKRCRLDILVGSCLGANGK